MHVTYFRWSLFLAYLYIPSKWTCILPSFLHPHLSIHAVSWRQQKSECLLGLAAISANSPSLPFINVTFTEPILRQTMPICSILTTYTALSHCTLSKSAGFVNTGDVWASIFVFLQISYWSLEQCSSCWRTFSGSPKNLSNLMASCLCWRHPGTGCFCRDTCLLSRELFHLKVMRIMMKTDLSTRIRFVLLVL